MKVRIEYTGQLRRSAGTGRAEFDCAEGTTLSALLASVARHGDTAFARLLVDANGDMRRSLVVAINGGHLASGVDSVLHEGDEILLLSPVAGG